MTSSGTYNFAPSIGELALSAFGRLQIRRATVGTEHLQDAQQEANLALVSFSNRGPNLWAVDLQSIPLVQAVPTYSVLGSTVMMLGTYITTTSGGTASDTTITPLSRDEYAAISEKTSPGRPTSFWYDRLNSQTVTTYPVADRTSVYTLNFYRYRQLQDASVAGGQTADLVYLFLDAFVAELAHRLSRYYAPQLEAQRKADADMAWNIAASQNTENVGMSITPTLSSYYR